MNLTKILIAIGIFLIIVFTSFIGGCQHGRNTKVCPTITTGITVTHDTVPHNVPIFVPWLISTNDSIVYVHDSIPVVIDSAKIVKAFYSKYYYTRDWHSTDSLLFVTQKDMVSQNVIYPQSFEYKWNGATTIENNSIDNSVNYSRYFNMGISTVLNNINYTSFRAMYIFEKGNFGIGYSPMGKSITLDAGYNLFTIKHKK